MSIAFLRIQKRKFAESLGAVKHAAGGTKASRVVSAGRYITPEDIFLAGMIR